MPQVVHETLTELVLPQVVHETLTELVLPQVVHSPSWSCPGGSPDTRPGCSPDTHRVGPAQVVHEALELGLAVGAGPQLGHVDVPALPVDLPALAQAAQLLEVALLRRLHLTGVAHVQHRAPVAHSTPGGDGVTLTRLDWAAKCIPLKSRYGE